MNARKPLPDSERLRVSEEIRDYILKELKKDFGNDFPIVESLIEGQLLTKGLKDLRTMCRVYLNELRKQASDTIK